MQGQQQSGRRPLKHPAGELSGVAVQHPPRLGQAQFCVLMVLTAQRLAAVCGLPEAVRRLCCELEHSEENLESLRLAFLRDAALSLGAFLRQLRS